MVRPVLRGSRSKDDSNDWVCGKCKATNRSFKLMLFDVPRLICSCGRKCPDFHFNMRAIKVNGRRIARNTKIQKGPTCIANAYAVATEIKHCIRELRHKRDPADLPELNANNLVDNLAKKFPNQVCRMKPPQKLVHMGLILKDKGIKAMVGKKYYKISDISTIESNNLQAMLNAIGNGEPLVAGPNWDGVGKIRQGDLSRSVVMLSRQEDAGRSFVDENGTSPEICRHNKLLLDGPATAEEDEQAIDNLEDAALGDDDFDDEDWQEMEDEKVGGLC